MFFYLSFLLLFPFSNQVTVTIPNLGTLQGISGDSFEAYLKIPYAKPPLETLRWMPPISPISWSGTLDSTNYPPGCPQPESDQNFYSSITFNEDCLFLSIWKPTALSSVPYPVVVWIHGGAYTYGAAAQREHTGEYMAKKEGIVQVLVQYRLGLLGFAALPELRELNPQKTTGNYGVLDQIAALKWVKKYISAFGGDPERITLAGESAGGASVAFHLVTPHSKTLFNQAILQSPSPLTQIRPLQESYYNTKTSFNDVCNFDKPGEIVSCLRSVKVETLISLQPTQSATIDGYVFNKNVFLSFENWVGLKSDVKAILIGNNLNEGTLWYPPNPIPQDSYLASISSMNNDLHAITADDISKISGTYPCQEDDCRLQWAQVIGDIWFICPANMISLVASASSTNVFMYLFSHAPTANATSSPWLKSFHGAEVAYFFNNVKLTYGTATDEELALSDKMSKSWANFVKGTYTDFYPSNSDTNFKRVEYKTPVIDPTPSKENWKLETCNQIWLPIFKANKFHLALNQSELENPSSTALLNIPGMATFKGLSGTKFDAFLKIPYANPPLDSLRWTPPLSPYVFKEAQYDSTNYGPVCPQSSIKNFLVGTTMSEDCLTLSIWKPKIVPTGGNPVVVWIHGGGFATGGIPTKATKGQHMAESEGIVFVSIQYRLGHLGFLALKELQAENEWKTTGNYGLLDQIAALNWVKKYISYFGGNPDQITIDGQSAGGSSVVYHLIMPQSKGLFKNAIPQSASFLLDIDLPNRKFAESEAIASLACSLESSDLLACLRKLPVEKILSASLDPFYAMRAMVDGYLFDRHPFLNFVPWTPNDHPELKNVLAGTTLNEGTVFDLIRFKSFQYSEIITGYHRWMKPKPTFLENLKKFYACPDENSCPIAEMIGDSSYVCPPILMSEAIAKVGPTKVYNYLFSQYTYSILWYTPNVGVPHGSELGYIFGNLGETYDFYIPDEQSLATSMTNSWTNFIKGDLSEFTEYASSKNFPRTVFNAPVKVPYDIIQSWKRGICTELWLPIFVDSFSYFVNNGSLAKSTIKAKKILTLPDLGIIEGLEYETYVKYLKVPYAAPPLGSLRWQPPSKPFNWTGIFESTSFPAFCPQNSTRFIKVNKIDINEDCLYLSITAPKNKLDGGNPVVVWLSSGFDQGGIQSNAKMGEYLAKNENTIFVSVQYRIGALGFGSFPNIKQNNTVNTTGAFGILDQIAALEWVKKYITYFDGNPNKVTLGGFGNGAESACLHLVSNRSKGLFNQVIMQDFECFFNIRNETESQNFYYSKLQEFVGNNNIKSCDVSSSFNVLLNCLRSLDIVSLNSYWNPAVGPSIEGFLLREHPYVSYRNLLAKNLTLNVTAILLGTNRKQQSRKGLIISQTNFLTEVKKLIQSLNQTDQNSIINYYKCTANDCTDVYLELKNDMYSDCPAEYIAQSVSNVAASKTKVFSFLFDYSAESTTFNDPKLGATIGSDLPFTWNNLDYSLEYYTANEFKLANAIGGTWAKFIKGDFSNFTEYAKSTGYIRKNFVMSDSFTFDNIKDWKKIECSSIWFPAYENLFGSMVYTENQPKVSSGIILKLVFACFLLWLLI